MYVHVLKCVCIMCISVCIVCIVCIDKKKRTIPLELCSRGKRPLSTYLKDCCIQLWHSLIRQADRSGLSLISQIKFSVLSEAELSSGFGSLSEVELSCDGWRSGKQSGAVSWWLVF